MEGTKHKVVLTGIDVALSHRETAGICSDVISTAFSVLHQGRDVLVFLRAFYIYSMVLR